ncbi:MAG: hypothetical protein RLZZ01_718 [Actinomycetota bacterium]
MQDANDTRARLIDAAIEVIEEHGESALRLADIAATVGIKQPSIYYFFQGREELVVAAQCERYRRTAAQAVGLFDSDLARASTKAEFVDAAERLLRFSFTHERSANRAIRLSLMAKALTSPTLLREINDASFESNRRFAEIIAEAQRKGWVTRAYSPMNLVVFLRGQVLARLLLEIDPERYDGDEWTDLAVSTILSSFITNDGGATD